MLGGMVGDDLIQLRPVGISAAQVAFDVLLSGPLHNCPPTDTPHIDVHEGDVASGASSKGCVLATLLPTPMRVVQWATYQDGSRRTYLWVTTLVISSLPVSRMRLMLSSMVERTTSAERMSLSLFLSAGRGGSGGGPELEEGMGLPLPPSFDGRFGVILRIPGAGL